MQSAEADNRCLGVYFWVLVLEKGSFGPFSLNVRFIYVLLLTLCEIVVSLS